MTDKQPIYAELPQSTGEHHYGGGIYTEAQLRLYADATHALRTQAHAAQAPVTDLQNVHDAVTVDLLNERVAYLEAKLKEAQAPQQAAPAVAEKFLESPDVQDESGLNTYYSRELVLGCIEAALSRVAPQQEVQIRRKCPDELAEPVYIRTLCKALDAALDFAGTVAGGSSWWQDVWAELDVELETTRENYWQAQPAPSGDVSKSGEESNMSDTELLDFICDNDRQRMVEQSGGFWRVYQDEAPLEAEHHLWQSMTSRRYSTAREAISAARKEGK